MDTELKRKIKEAKEHEFFPEAIQLAQKALDEAITLDGLESIATADSYHVLADTHMEYAKKLMGDSTKDKEKEEQLKLAFAFAYLALRLYEKVKHVENLSYLEVLYLAGKLLTFDTSCILTGEDTPLGMITRVEERGHALSLLNQALFLAANFRLEFFQPWETERIIKLRDMILGATFILAQENTEDL